MFCAIFYYQKTTQNYAIHQPRSSSSAQPGIRVPKGDLDDTERRMSRDGDLGERFPKPKENCHAFTSWWFQPNWKIWVKLEIFPE